MPINAARRDCYRLLQNVHNLRNATRYPFAPMQTAKLDLISQPTSDAGLKVIRLEGKLALETVHTFVQTMRADAAPRLVLDMGGVSFLDSAGVGALVQIFVHRRAKNQGFALAALTQQGDAVMTVAGLKKMLPTYDSVDAAQQASAASA